jgi:WD40 repeat protein/mono/diheme cytochrome c family protein
MKQSFAQPPRERAGEVGRRPGAREVKLADRYHFMTSSGRHNLVDPPLSGESLFRVVSVPLTAPENRVRVTGFVIRPLAWLTMLFGLGLCVQAAAPAKSEALDPNAPVSYWKQIRPLFQAHCQGCHQPAKSKGGYVMTDFHKLLAGGDSGDKAIVAGKPEASFLIASITPKDGEAEMPKDKAPLKPDDVALVRTWVAQGAVDDTPKNAVQRYDADHPPIYQRPPVVTSIDYAPDGKLLAVAGFHEVLLNHADGSGIAARLVGLSERIQSVRFSPDGTRLAVAGGLPARMGEVQIWDVEKRSLVVSVPVGYDTVYGVSWSPDGKLVAFGCPDNTVRAVDAATGEQVLQQGSHNDWVLDTVFNKSGTHIISVGRDMSTKLTEVETQRFVDNITSITPGALRGGLHAVALRPGSDEVLIGGADGVPQVYQVFRKTARRIGDNANLLRKFPAMEGRIFAVDYSNDGKLIAAASSYNGRGAVNLYTGEFDPTIPDLLLKAYAGKIASAYNAEEKAAIEKFTTAEVKLVAETKFDVGVYALAFSPDGQTVAAAGEDGHVRLISTSDGKVTKDFVPVPVTAVAVTKTEKRPAARR